MNISVYFYDEDGNYTHMDMAPLEFTEEGVQILPDNSTNIYPPDLATKPKFSKELNKWIPQVAKEPYSSEDFKASVEEIRKEFAGKVEALEATVKEVIEKEVDLSSIESKLTMQRKSIDRIEADYNRTKYYLGVFMPDVKHFFE